MLPSLGLFKSIPCPLYPNCQRSPCFYSHTKQRSSTIQDRPIETVKRQKTAIEVRKENAKKPAISATVPKNEPFIPSLIPTPASSKPPPTKSSAYADPLASLLLKGSLAKAKADLGKTSRSVTETNNRPLSAIEAKKRVAHTSTVVSQPTGPPQILPNMKSKIPLQVRQLIATKLFEAFKRIYEPILKSNPTIATEHAKRQEENILTATTNVGGYKQLAAGTLMRLKKRPLCHKIDDAGIDGEWEDPKDKAASMAWLDRINECTASIETLKQLEYPLPELLEHSDEPLDNKEDMVGTIHECDRCHQEYMIKAVLDKEDVDKCVYHPRRMIMIKVDGIKQKVYGCCEDPLGSPGCKRGPHVYKDEDPRILHQKIPFVKVPPKDPKSPPKERMVALDCEMGYTTIGMELIRLTAVNEKMEILLDELVLPSSMIVDLNTSYSGVQTLEGVKYDLHSLRKELFKYIDEDTILVGHGLENDMNALRIIHTNIIDTVDLFPHKNGLPYRNSLKLLASAHLKKFIQTGTEGHDSLEDARTCVELLEIYIKKVLDKKPQVNSSTS